MEILTAIIQLLGGLAMFLYGIEVMGDGLKNSSGAALKRVLEKVPVLSNLYLLLVVLLGWVIFRFTNLELGLTLVRSLFGANGNALTTFASTVQLKSNMYLLAVSVLASTPIMKWLRQVLEPFCHRRGNLGVYWDVFFYSILPVCLLLLSLLQNPGP